MVLYPLDTPLYSPIPYTPLYSPIPYTPLYNPILPYTPLYSLILPYTDTFNTSIYTLNAKSTLLITSEHEHGHEQLRSSMSCTEDIEISPTCPIVSHTPIHP